MLLQKADAMFSTPDWTPIRVQLGPRKEEYIGQTDIT